MCPSNNRDQPPLAMRCLWLCRSRREDGTLFLEKRPLERTAKRDRQSHAHATSDCKSVYRERTSKDGRPWRTDLYVIGIRERCRLAFQIGPGGETFSRAQPLQSDPWSLQNDRWHA
jgi:hypothetical protein